MKTQETSSRHFIGIDLGTTNCALASLPQNETAEKPEPFQISQIIDQGMQAPRKTLPSFEYIPTEAEAENHVYQLAWDATPELIAGEWARKQGEKLPGRLISSAKSWLSTSSGKLKNLPLTAPADVPKYSAVEASSCLLTHLKQEWNLAHPQEPLEQEELILTVPASFDAVARDLTLEAAKMAGLPQVVLLEEPVAAFYAWISHTPDWRKEVSVGDVVLVCDIGGGTTDFSLIAVEEVKGELQLTRIAVGNHILLGGDNMDLALARTIQLKFEKEGKTINQSQWLSLAHSCRHAKEKLLGDASLAEVPVVLPGRGSQLMGGTLQTRLTRKEMMEVLLEGFFAPCSASDIPQEPRKTGLRTVGLNYASDPAILKHLAHFLRESLRQIAPDHSLNSKLEGKSFVHPSVILFNGGVTHATAFCERIQNVLNQWLKEEGSPEIKVLKATDPDLAVALGAAYYGQARSGKGVRVRSATTFAYYLGVESSLPAIPGMPPVLNGLCVAPAGMEEGTALDIPGIEFGLVVGEMVEFPFYISRTRPEDQAGSLIEDARSSLEELAIIETTLSREETAQASGTVIPVTLRVVLTELGSLEIWCDAVDHNGNWKLEFHLRKEGE
ncbi:MAG: Hsp70 family protein [SAR324 cluster bacterium]|nr:Hsp70 family protein [SAR324 cluster bacterium]